MTVHELKCWPEYFVDVADGRKPYECRKNDRDYKVGDVLHIYEYEPRESPTSAPAGYTGQMVARTVTHILGDEFEGVAEGFVVMGLVPAVWPQQEAKK